MSYFARILFWILIIASVAISSLWVIGGKVHEYSTSLTINASPESIFPYLTEPERIKAWSEGLLEVGKMESNIDDNGYSRRILSERVVSNQGSEQVFVDEVLRFDENKTLSVQSTSSSVVNTTILSLKSDGDGTKVSYRFKTAHRGLDRFAAPFRDDAQQQRIDRELRNLKNAVESESQDPSGKQNITSAIE